MFKDSISLDRTIQVYLMWTFWLQPRWIHLREFDFVKLSIASFLMNFRLIVDRIVDLESNRVKNYVQLLILFDGDKISK